MFNIHFISFDYYFYQFLWDDGGFQLVKQYLKHCCANPGSILFKNPGDVGEKYRFYLIDAAFDWDRAVTPAESKTPDAAAFRRMGIRFRYWTLLEGRWLQVKYGGRFRADYLGMPKFVVI